MRYGGESTAEFADARNRRIVKTGCVGCMERRGDATRWFDDLHGAGLITERSAMSLTKSPASNFGSGSSLRTVMTTGAAALIGTVIGGVSVLGIVMAVTPPPNHEIRSDARVRQRNGYAAGASRAAAGASRNTAAADRACGAEPKRSSGGGASHGLA